MRAKDFIIEYSRAVTQERLGKAVYAKMMKDRTVQDIFGDDPLELIRPETVLEFGLDRFESADPTPNKQYVQWIARTYAKDPTFSMEDVLGQVAAYLEKFHKLNQRKKLPSPRNDINRYDSFADFMSVMDEFDDPTAQELTDKGESRVVYEDDNIRVIEPEDKAAACYYGQGTRWCTAATRGSNYFDHYANTSPLFIVLPKKSAYPGEKYQLWFDYSIGDDRITSDADYLEAYHFYGEEHVIEYENYGQFMNEKDQDVGLRAIAKRFGSSFSGLLNKIEQNYPKIQYAINKNLEDAGIN